MAGEHLTVKGSAEASYLCEQGSKLRARLLAAGNLSVAQEATRRLRLREPHAWAWRGIQGAEHTTTIGERHFDVGQVLLEQLETTGVRGVLLVVERGVGERRLSRRETRRAYAAAARAVFAGVEVVLAPVWVGLHLNVPSGEREEVERLLEAHGAQIRFVEVRTRADLWLDVAAEDEAQLLRAVGDRGRWL